jgi:hypothetical protein
MRALLPAAAVVLVAGTAAQALTVDRPPARYDHTHPNLLIVETRHSQVPDMCRRLLGHWHFARHGRLHACASIGDGRSPCLVVLPRVGANGITKGVRQALLRHERAHCNGWPGHHPH